MKTLPKDDISLSPVTDNEWLSRPRLFSLLGSFQEAHRMFHWAEGDGTDPGVWSLLDSSSLCCLCTIWLSLILCFPILKKSEPVPQNYYEIKWDDDGKLLYKVRKAPDACLLMLGWPKIAASAFTVLTLGWRSDSRAEEWLQAVEYSRTEASGRQGPERMLLKPYMIRNLSFIWLYLPSFIHHSEWEYESTPLLQFSLQSSQKTKKFFSYSLRGS